MRGGGQGARKEEEEEEGEEIHRRSSAPCLTTVLGLVAAMLPDCMMRTLTSRVSPACAGTSVTTAAGGVTRKRNLPLTTRVRYMASREVGQGVDVSGQSSEHPGSVLQSYPDRM